MAYTTTTNKQASKHAYAMGAWWRYEKKKTSKKDLVTNTAGWFAGDESQLEHWFSVASDQSQWKRLVAWCSGKSGRIYV